MEKLEQLQEVCRQCQKCALGRERQNLVFGDGNPRSSILFVGEGPGEQEDRTGIPFVGPAGKLLDQMLEIIDLDRSQYYIANIVKCRPPGNRDPREEEQEACMDYLRAQVRIIQPKVIVCLGRIAAQRLISRDFRISRQHGTWVKSGPFWMTALYHPSALLRDMNKRPATFEDLMYLQAKLRELGLATCEEENRYERKKD